jgi:DNA-nicking Smr family endonuclease
MPKKLLISEEEKALFRASVQGTVILKQDTANTPKKTPSKVKIKPTLSAPFDMCPLYEHHMMKEVYSEDYLFFARPGLQHRVTHRLRAEKFSVDAELDLHGLTMEEAHEILYRFLIEATEQQWHWVRIIHGKGSRNEEQQPVLKNKVNYWLRQYAQVLAFCSAKPGHGGVGAVNVLLRRG